MQNPLKKPRRVAIVDPQLVDMGGHHADINYRLARAMLGMGHDVTIYSNKRFQQKFVDVPVAAVFNEVPYNLWGKNSYSSSESEQLSDWGRYKRQFAETLSGIDRPELIVLPTLFSYQLSAISSHEFEKIPTVGIIHHGPAMAHESDAMNWRMLLSELGRTENLRIGTLEPQLLLAYESITTNPSLNIELFPIPHDGANTAPVIDRPFTIGLLGHQRETKGSNALAQTFEMLLSIDGVNVIFQDSAEVLKINVPPALQSNLRYVGRVPSIGQLISQCSCVLLNYDPIFYRVSGSGIAWEAVASGVPVIAPMGSTISNFLKLNRCGTVFNPYSKTSLVEAVMRVKGDLNRFVSESVGAQRRYHELHGTKTLAENILNSESTGAGLSSSVNE